MLLFRQKSLDLRIEITGYLDGVRDAVLKYALCHLFHLSLTQKSDISGINRTQNQMFHITVHASNSTALERKTIITTLKTKARAK